MGLNERILLRRQQRKQRTNTEYKNDYLNIVNSWLFVIRLQRRAFYFCFETYITELWTESNVKRLKKIYFRFVRREKMAFSSNDSNFSMAWGMSNLYALRTNEFIHRRENEREKSPQRTLKLNRLKMNWINERSMTDPIYKYIQNLNKSTRFAYIWIERKDIDRIWRGINGVWIVIPWTTTKEWKEWNKKEKYRMEQQQQQQLFRPRSDYGIQQILI